MTNRKTIYLAEPLGFCGGVRRAMELFEQTAANNAGKPIYVLHELVHNRTVTENMKAKNAHFVENLQDIPDGAITVFGAHGIGSSIEKEAQRRNLQYCDAVCPLVAQLQTIAATADEHIPLILYGDKEHPEVRSVLERASSKQIFILAQKSDVETLPPLKNALLLCQTTRNAHEVRQVAQLLQKRIPLLIDKSKVCDAVSRRQQAVYDLSPKCDMILIVGSPHSSNGRRMLAIAEENCPKVQMLETADELNEEAVKGVFCVGIGAATSTPDYAIHGVIAKLQQFGYQLN